MKKTKELQVLHVGRLFTVAVFTIALVLSLSLFLGYFSIVSHAESSGKVVSDGGANVRSSASSSATQVTSLAKNDRVSIRSQVQGSDGYTWYEVWVDAETRGYVRSDLVEITDGTTPPTSTQKPSDAPQPAVNDNLEPAKVNRVNPISAAVSGGSGGVRIRSNASTSSQIVTTVTNGLALTINGQADSLDKDGKVWYQVNFLSDNTEVSGFIREDYVTLSGELTPYIEPDADPNDEPDSDNTPGTGPLPEVPKEYDTYEEDGKWYVDTPKGTYDIQALLEMNETYTTTLADSNKSIKSQKIVIVILVLILVAAVAAIGYLVYKMKDMMDSAYFNAVENETLRRRSGQGGRVMPTVGADKKGAQRPAGAPQGQRPAGAPQGQRPAGGPQGQKPAGAPQSQRPAGGPQGQRPAGAPQSQKPAGAPQSQKPAGAPQSQKPVGAPQGQSSARTKPKNFMTEDDEFEFEFLNYDGKNEK